MKKNNVKKNTSPVNNALAKKFDYEGITRSACEEFPWYAEIADGRKHRPCKRFDLTDKVYFEFWDEDEFEFSVYDDGNLELKMTAAYLVWWLKAQNNKASRLPSLMAYCKERLMAAA